MSEEHLPLGTLRGNSRKPILLIFMPFAAGYFLSYLFRTINGPIADSLIGEFSLGPRELGLLTSLYFLTFAAFQIPAGMLIDRYGPRRQLAWGTNSCWRPCSLRLSISASWVCAAARCRSLCLKLAWRLRSAGRSSPFNTVLMPPSSALWWASEPFCRSLPCPRGGTSSVDGICECLFARRSSKPTRHRRTFNTLQCREEKSP